MIRNKPKHFALFYPSKELGGAELLFSRLADQLSARGHKVTVLDSELAIIFRNLRNPAVVHRLVTLDQTISIDCDFLIAFASHVNSLGRYINPNENCKVFFWSVHPLNAIFLIPRYGEKLFDIGLDFLKLFNQFFFKAEDRVRGKALKSLLESNAFACMDGENSRVLSRYYGLKSDFKFIPVPVLLPEKAKLSVKTKAGNPIVFAWYGRLCDFKVYVLIYLIFQLAKVQKEVNLRLLIIGDGPLKGLVERAVEDTEIIATFKGAMPNEDARALINQEADIVFAMGTAALEAGAMGIPTVLVDASYRPVNFQYRFNWLHEARQFSLGRFINKSTPVNGMSINEIIREVRVNYNFQSVASFKYVELNHDINRVTELIEKSCEKSKMSLSGFLDITDYKRSLVLRAARSFYKLMFKSR